MVWNVGVLPDQDVVVEPLRQGHNEVGSMLFAGYWSCDFDVEPHLDFGSSGSRCED